MRLSLLLALFAAVSFQQVLAQGQGPDDFGGDNFDQGPPPDGQGPDDQGGFENFDAQGGPNGFNDQGNFNDFGPNGPPGPPGPNGFGPNAQGGPPGPPGPFNGPPGPHNQGPGGPSGARRNTRRFRPNEELLLRGDRCYLRPECQTEFAKCPFKAQLKGPRLVCDPKGKPNPNQREFVWRAQPCTNPQNQKRGVVRFENGKHKGKFLCVSCSPIKEPNRRHGTHIGIMGCRTNKGCTWSVKKAKVFNRKTKALENRFVFINQDFNRFMLRTRRKCKQSPAGPQGTYAAQNYIEEGQIDGHGSFAIEPAVQNTGYQL